MNGSAAMSTNRCPAKSSAVSAFRKRHGSACPEFFRRPEDAHQFGQGLVRRPDYLFLDEPTNHLDMDMLEWLEGYLLSYGGGILIVSHDRYFLDRVATGILELSHGKVTKYKGNYTRYVEQHDQQQKALERAYKKQQEHIHETERIYS